MTSLLRRLRDDTADLHRHTEARVPIVHGHLTLTAYGRWLGQLLSLYQPLEDALATLPIPAAFALPDRRKAPHLHADLRQLGFLERPAPLIMPSPFPLPAAFGTLYVLEGATLGGQIISRHLHRHLHVGPENGGRFYHGYGADTGAMWRAFGAALEAAVAPPQHDEVVAGARLGFRLFASVMA